MNSTHETKNARAPMHGYKRLASLGAGRRWLLGAIAVTLTQSCATTPLVWTKPGAEPSATSRELADCRLLATDLMWRMGWEDMWPPFFYDPLYMPPFYRASRPFWLGVPNSLELKQSLITFCMHSKGYRQSPSPD
jgi:hypothetical protein